MSELYRLVYASKNLLQGSQAEISAAVTQILATSQHNNARVGVTGALMFNDGAFAQVLEGPRLGVEATFERIQRDLRHADVTVLQCAQVFRRGFPNWSMAFVGRSARGEAAWSRLAAESGFDLSRLNGDELFGMLHKLVLEEEIPPTGAISPAPFAHEVQAAVSDMNEKRAEPESLRLDLASGRAVSAHGSTAGNESDDPYRNLQRAPVANGSAQAALAILRAALASERARTTALRDELDDLRIALTAANEREVALRHERACWAQQAHLLANALGQEAAKVCHATEQSSALSCFDHPSGAVAA